MKISIITMHNYPNYGSALQAFATQEKLKEFADVVEIVDYSGGESTVGRSLADYFLADFKSGAIVKSIAKLPFRLRRRSVFGSFAKQYFNMTPSRYTTESDLKKFPVHDGYYCTGSDQVWNPTFIENMRFFWDFIPEHKKKFGYAVSFGNYKEEKLSIEIIDRIKKYIDQYEHISVREERGLKILQEQLCYKNSIQLVDPTLAMPAEFWRKLAPPPRIKHEYILLYQLGRERASEASFKAFTKEEESFETFAKGLSERTKLPLIRLFSKGSSQLFKGSGKKIILPSVLQFITLIDNAKYIITDSFHGTAFSMLLNKEHFVYRETYDGGRITGFLRLMGQEHRYITDCTDFSIIDRLGDFKYVNNVLERERERVDEFLRSVFGKEGKA